MLNWATNGPAEFILVIGANLSDRIKIVSRIQVGIAHEFEDVPVQGIGARLRNDVDLPAAVVPVFRVVVIGKNAELGQRVKIRNGRRATIPEFLDDKTVQQEAVVCFTLSIDRDS